MQQTQSKAFKIGRGILLFFAGGNVFGHLGLWFFERNPTTVFLAWAALDLLAAGILFYAYPRAEKWAWVLIWGFVIPFALVIFINPEIGPIYLGEAGLMALGQILTFRTFFR